MTNGKNSIQADGKTPISRRRFAQAATAVTFGTAWGGIAAPLAGAEEPLRKELSPDVQMQFMRPAQLEKTLRDFPVVYVPFGLIEGQGTARIAAAQAGFPIPQHHSWEMVADLRVWTRERA